MQLHKYAMQQASKLNLSLLIRLLLSLLLNPYAFFRAWLYEIENHFLCKGGIMKNIAKVPTNYKNCLMATNGSATDTYGEFVSLGWKHSLPCTRAH